MVKNTFYCCNEHINKSVNETKSEDSTVCKIHILILLFRKQVEGSIKFFLFTKTTRNNQCQTRNYVENTLYSKCHVLIILESILRAKKEKRMPKSGRPKLNCLLIVLSYICFMYVSRMFENKFILGCQKVFIVLLSLTIYDILL